MHLRNWLLTAVLAGAAPTLGLYPDPHDDFFYRVPLDITSYAPGDVLRTRPIVSTVAGRTVSSLQMFYVTTDAQGNASGTVGTVWVPAMPAYPPKIFSYQFAEDSVNLDCSPSWAYVNRSSPQTSATSEAGTLVLWALSRGYYAVNVDNEGPFSGWLDGYVEGQSVLDGIRATIGALGLPANSTQAGLFGYSGAAHATVWASTLAVQYAPDINIAGAAYGGTPIDVMKNYDALNGGPAATLAALAIFGLGNANPDLNNTISHMLNKKGTHISETVRSRNFCAINQLEHYAGLNFTTAFSGDFFGSETVQRILSRNSLLSNVSRGPVPVPKFPRYQFHGVQDELVPFEVAQQYVQEQCLEGANIHWVAYPALGHGGASIAGLPGAMEFLAQAFDGTVKPTQCGGNFTAPAIGSNSSLNLLGLNNNIILAAQLAAVGGS